MAACNQERQQRLCFSTYYECRYVPECQGLVPLIRNATLSACCCKVLSTPSCGGLGRQWEVCLKFWKQSSLFILLRMPDTWQHRQSPNVTNVKRVNFKGLYLRIFLHPKVFDVLSESSECIFIYSGYFIAVNMQGF